MNTFATFFRLVDVDPDSKSNILRQVIQAARPPEMSGLRFVSSLKMLRSIPTAPFAYWAPMTLLRAFETHSRYESDGRTALQGASTCDDFRFVRAWFEISTASTTVHDRGLSWVAFARGGRFSRFYADVPAIVRWDRTRTSFHGFIGRSGRWNPKPVSADHYLQPGLTWPLRGAVFSCSMLPAGCAYSVGGKVALAPREELPFLAAVLNSSVFNAAISLFAGKVGGFQFETGIINQAPVPQPLAVQTAPLGSTARCAWSLKRCLDTRTETSHAFMLPALLQVTGDTLTARAAAWAEHVHTIEAELATIQAEIDARCFDLYGIDEADRRAITEGFGSITPSASLSEADPNADVESESEADDEEDIESSADATILVAELVSWAVGVAFGRFDVRLATGVRALPPEPEPFDPLPVCSPAMLTGNDGLVLGGAPSVYPLTFPENGILVDDPGHLHDLTTAVRAVVDVVFGARADAIWEEASALLDPKDHELGAWLSSSFFEHHLKRHSKSRRKAPIFWQLGTPSGRYSVWLYAHRLTRDSFFQLQNDVVATKLVHEERQLTSLVQRAGGSPLAKERKMIATQETFVEALRAMLDEMKRVVPLWNPTLDDGVVLTMAPLWRLMPRCKPWQKELKSKWDELCAGKYDWAHLAMHLWPERVVPKCATDRSLAIAHGLEDAFWVKGAAGKWQLRATPTCPVDELIRDRTSPAVKAALTSLIEAPVITAGGRRGRTRMEVSI